MMAIVLTLTMTACGKGGSDKKETDGGNGTVSSGDYVYSAQPVALQDSDGFLADFNMESLTYKDGRLYSSGYSYSFSDSGTHAIANFAPDGSDLQYSLLIGGGILTILTEDPGRKLLTSALRTMIRTSRTRKSRSRRSTLPILSASGSLPRE